MHVQLKELVGYLEKNTIRFELGKNYQPDFAISGPSSIQKAEAFNLCFLGPKFAAQAAELLSNCKASVLFIDSALYASHASSVPTSVQVLVLSDEVKKTCVDCVRTLFAPVFTPKVDPTAQIAEGVIMGENTHIGAFAVIEDGVRLGSNCVVGAQTVIKRGTRIGNRVQIGSCTVIGGSGFGFVKNESGQYENFPHFGAVILEDDVSVGSNTCIDRGSFSDTVIKRGVKIDNLVHIAHNVEIGEDSLVIACSMIAGSVQIGKNAWIAPSASVRNALTLGDDVTVGLGSVVVKNIESGSTVSGVPADDLETFKKIRGFLKKGVE